MDLNTVEVEVLGLWNLPHIGGENLYLSYPPGSGTKGRPFSDEKNDSGDPGGAYFAFVFSCPRLLYDSECPLFLMV